MTDVPETCYATRVATLLSAATDEWRKSDYGAAEKICRQALDIAAQHLGKENRAYGYCLEDLGIILTARQNLDGARHALEEALGVMEKALGSRAPEVERIFGRLHDLYY